MSREIKPINVSRWPWRDEVIHWTWRDSQCDHYSRLRAKQSRDRLVALCLLITAVALVYGLICWITL